MPKKVHNSRTLKSYTLKEKDIRFLKAVDVIVKANKEHNISPKNQSEVSLIISSDPSTISKIRRSQRGITLEQMMTFCSYFHIDHNYFFTRHPGKLQYTPKVVSKKSGAKAGADFNLAQDYVEKVKEAMNECPLALQEKCLALIREMQGEIQKSNSELKQARENEKDALKKYISLLEKLEEDNLKHGA